MLTDEFLDSVKVSGAIPDDAFTDDEILSLATEELRNKITPILIASRSDYLLTFKDIPLVASQAGYDIPSRAVAQKAHEVQLVDSAGSVTNLPQVSAFELDRFDSSVGGNPSCFSMRGSKIILHPTPSNSDHSLRVYFYSRPSKLVKITDGAKVSAISGLVVTVETNTKIVLGSVCDFVSKVSGADKLSEEAQVTAISGTQITFDEIPADLAVGDFVAIEKETQVIPIPEDFIPYLVALTARRVMESQNDSAAFKMLDSRVEAIERDIKNILQPRVEGETKKIVNPRSWF